MVICSSPNGLSAPKDPIAGMRRPFLKGAAFHIYGINPLAGKFWRIKKSALGRVSPKLNEPVHFAQKLPIYSRVARRRRPSPPAQPWYKGKNE